MATDKETRVIEVIANGKKAEATMTQIQSAIKLLNAEIRKLPANSDQAKQKMAEMAKLNTRFRDLNAEMRGLNKNTSAFWTQMKAGMIGVLGGNLLTNFMGALNSMTFGILKGAAKMDDLRADVRKTTQLTEVGMQQLEDKMSAFNTRTAKSQLMELAVVAGQLGIEGVENIEQFVRAADTLTIALGDELGTDGVTAVGKINDLFGKTKSMGIEASINATGSAINSLAQKSSATAPFIVDFTKQLAGASVMANQSVENTLGLAATLDQLGQRGETAATAMQQLFVKMLQDTSFFANVAGMSVSDYTNLVNTDFNAALLKVLTSLKNNSAGLGEFATKMDEAGMDGTRAIGVISSLSNNIEILTRNQAISNEEYKKGSSLAEEAAIKQNNLAGALDRLDKKWEALKNSTGSKNAMTELVNVAGSLLNVIIALIPFLGFLTKTLLIGVSAWTAYKIVQMASLAVKKESLLLFRLEYYAMVLKTAATKAATVATALYTGGTKAASVAMAEFNAYTKANPLGLLLGALTAVVTAWYMFSNSADNASKKVSGVSTALDQMEEVNKQAAESMKDTTAQVKKMFDELSKTNTGTKERSALITELNNKYGTHLQDLKDEAAFLKQVAAAEQEVINKIVLKAHADAAAIKIKELSVKEMEKQMRLDAIEARIDKGGNIIGLLYDRQKLQNEINDIKDQYKELFDYQAKKRAELEAAGGFFAGGGGSGSGGGETEADKAFKDAIKKEATLHQQTLTSIYVEAAEKKHTKAQVDESLEKAHIEHLTRILEIEKKFGKDQSETALELAKANYAALKEQLVESSKAESNPMLGNSGKYSIDEQKKYYEQRAAMLRKINDEDADAAHEAKIQDLHAERDLELENHIYTEEEKARITEYYRRKEEQLNREHNLKKAEQYVDAARRIESVLNSFSNYIEQDQLNELNRFKKDQSTKERALKVRLDKGLINQAQYNSEIEKLQAETAEKERIFKTEQFKRDKQAAIIRGLIGTAEAVISALKYDPTGILATFVGGLGLAQVAAIAAQPIPEFAEGGRTRVKGQSGRWFNADYYSTDFQGGRVSGPGYLAGERGQELVIPSSLLTNPNFVSTASMIDAAIATGRYSNSTAQQNAGNAQVAETLAANQAVMSKLLARLDEPFYGLAYFDKDKYDRRLANEQVIKDMSRIAQ